MAPAPVRRLAILRLPPTLRRANGETARPGGARRAGRSRRGTELRAVLRVCLATVAAVALLAGTPGVIIGATGQNGPFTGCLDKKGAIYNVAASETAPLAPCKTGDALVTFSKGQGAIGPPAPPVLPVRPVLRGSLARMQGRERRPILPASAARAEASAVSRGTDRR
jgi:hypothetical protein